MNGNQANRIPCPKCGAMMDANARCCIKCGTINPNLETNKIVQKSLQKSIDNYKSGVTELFNEHNDNMMIANNTGNKSFAFYVTYLLYLAFVLLLVVSAYTNGINSLDFLIVSEYPILLVIGSLMFIYIYSIELIFMKSNKRWWAGFIPIYNLMVLGEIAFHNKYIGLLSIVPIIGQIFMFVMFYKLGEKFKYNGLLTALFVVIFLPIIGLSDHLYEEKVMLTNGNQRSLEKDYRHKKVFVTTFVLFFLCGMVLFIMGNMGKVRKANEAVGNSYYVYASTKVIDKVRKGINDGKVKCNGEDYNPTQGVYYFNYPDLGNKVHLPFYLMRESISAYVKVDNNVNPPKYYVSMSDGTYGFAETVEEEIDEETVIEYSNQAIVNSGNMCEITN